jgi:hypothetical protein
VFTFELKFRRWVPEASWDEIWARENEVSPAEDTASSPDLRPIPTTIRGKDAVLALLANPRDNRVNNMILLLFIICSCQARSKLCLGATRTICGCHSGS